MTPAEETFVKLYEDHYDDVHRFCVRRVGRADAEDAAADVFSVVWRRLDRFDPGIARAWVYGIARNVVRNHWRSTTRRGHLVGRIRAFGLIHLHRLTWLWFGEPSTRPSKVHSWLCVPATRRS